MVQNRSDKFFLLMLIFLSLRSDRIVITCNKTEEDNSIWFDAGRVTGLLVKKCMDLQPLMNWEQFSIFQRCLRRRSLMLLDRELQTGIIDITNGIQLVKHEAHNERKINSKLQFGYWPRSFNEDESDWSRQVLSRITHLFDTHVLKIRLNGDDSKNSGRRRKDNMMLSIMMFGMVAVGMVVIPMGFQFLAVLGGKALLLAKLSLILTSIQGLKKIATSNLNYGLYSTTGLGQPWHYDRQAPAGVDGQPPEHYYDVSEPHTDLLHPLQPRVDFIKRYVED